MSKIQLPKGFKAITGGGNSWRPEKPGDQIQGLYVGSKSVHQEAQKVNGRKIPARDVNVHTIKTKNGEIGVWESGGLRALGKLKKGQKVCVVYAGKKTIKGQSNPMREFIVGVS